MEIKQGDIIKLKPEWMDKGDENIVFSAVEDSDHGRVYVKDKNSKLFIPPQSLVHDFMIESINGKLIE